jgi:hypothetical protein
MNHFLLGCLSFCLLSASGRCDELHLKDGRVLVGSVRAVGETFEVQTREGLVRVPQRLVVRHLLDSELRKDFEKLADRVGDGPHDHLRLAIEARRHGLAKELWRHLDAALAAAKQEKSAAFESQLHGFLAQLEPDLLDPRWRKAETSIRVRELLSLLTDRPERQPGRRAALVELLRRELNADRDLRAHARRNPEPARRLLAIEALARRGTAGNDTFTLRTAILDNEAEVRREAVRIARDHNLTVGAVGYLAPGLMHGNADVRIRTAEAMEAIGDVAAVKHLVVAGPSAGKALAKANSAARAHVAFIQQQAYVQDFNVEVASASFIADPKIGVLQSGAVLDVTILGVEQYRLRIQKVYRRVIHKLAGSDPGADADRWPTWLMRNPVPEAPTPVTGDR